MADLVERVAKAIEEECAGCDPRDGQAFKDAAKAAIEAMREPTLAMQEAAVGDADQGSVWRKMIDAALKDG